MVSMFQLNSGQTLIRIRFMASSQGGVPVTAFPEDFRCPATIECILGVPQQQFFTNGYVSLGLNEPWISDLACPFTSCSWSTESGTPPPSTAVELGLPTECGSLAQFPIFCDLHPGAAFCVRTNGAPEGFANQASGSEYDAIVCMYVWSSHTARVRINRVRLPILLVVS